MTQVKTEHESRYRTPTFDPRSAFARTLRGGKMARLGLLSRQSDRTEVADSEPAIAQKTRHEERCYETPTFDPRGAFARTLRGGEMSRHERRLRSDARPDVFAYAS